MPITQYKSLILVDYKGSRVREGLPYISPVPNGAERAGDFSDRLTGQSFSPCPAPGPGESFDTGTIFDPFSTRNYTCVNPDPNTGQPVSVQLRDPISYNSQLNVIPPTIIDATGPNIANMYPMPNGPGLFHKYSSSPSRITDHDSFDIRLDHHFSEQDQILAG